MHRHIWTQGARTEWCACGASRWITAETYSAPAHAHAWSYFTEMVWWKQCDCGDVERLTALMEDSY